MAVLQSEFCNYLITDPTIAAAATPQAEFTRKPSSPIKLTPNTTSVFQSRFAAFANCIATTAINASEPATTPSSAAAATADLRTRTTSGPNAPPAHQTQSCPASETPKASSPIDASRISEDSSIPCLVARAQAHQLAP